MTRSPRAGWRLRAAIRIEQRAFFSHNWRGVACLLIATATSCAVVWIAAGDPVRSLLVGALVASLLWMLVLLGLLHGGWWNNYVGSLGEEIAATCLRQLKRDGFVLLHSLPGPRGDIDHVAIGPTHAFAIETKWRSAAWGTDRHRDRDLGAAARQAQLNADRVRRLTQVAGVQTVTPLVFVTGPAARAIGNADRTLDGVMVIAPQRDKKWARRAQTADARQNIDVTRARDLLLEYSDALYGGRSSPLRR